MYVYYIYNLSWCNSPYSLQALNKKKRIPESKNSSQFKLQVPYKITHKKLSHRHLPRYVGSIIVQSKKRRALTACISRQHQSITAWQKCIIWRVWVVFLWRMKMEKVLKMYNVLQLRATFTDSSYVQYMTIIR